MIVEKNVISMNNKNKVTLKSIAAECNVSAMSVSHALNPRKQHHVSKATREKILKAIEKHNYTRNLSASRLRRQKTECLTLVMGVRVMRGPQIAPDFDAHHEALSWGLVRGIITEARKFNYDVKLEALVDIGLTDDVIKHIKPELTDGVIFESSSETGEIIDYIKSLKIPYVVLNDSGLSKKAYISKTVSFSMESGIHTAIDELLKSGRKRIAYAGNDKSGFSNSCCKIIIDALKKKNIFNQDLMFNVKDFFDIKSLVSSWNGKLNFDALIGLNDTVADLFYKELSFAGFKIPEDCALIGIGGNPAYQGAGRSCISSIKLPFYELASEGVKSLIDIIESNHLCLQKNKFLETEFIKSKTS
jgi:DNA-binding LacI/PurR family transcriptional regulator